MLRMSAFFGIILTSLLSCKTEVNESPALPVPPDLMIPDDGEPPELNISSEPLSGVFEGEPWDYKIATVSKDSFEPGLVELNFYPFEAESPCELNGFSQDGKDGRILSVSVPEIVGTYHSENIISGSTTFLNFVDWTILSDVSNNLTDYFNVVLEDLEPDFLLGRLG